MKHSSRGPSGAHRWMHCAGQIEHCKHIPRSQDNEPARIGTGGHAIVDRTLSKQELFLPGDILNFEYDNKPTWIQIPAEMLEHTDVYLRRVAENMSRRPGSRLYAEKRVDLEHVLPGMFGHTDTTIDQWDTLIVMDFKYGFVPVHLVGNTEALLFFDYDAAEIDPQPLIYACGEANESSWVHEHIQLDIVQPRSMEVAPIQTVTVPAKWLRHWQDDVLRPAAIATTLPDAPLTPGPWCRFCPANQKVAGEYLCPAVAKQTQEILELDFREFQYDPAPPFQLTKDNILKVLEWTPVIKQWLVAVHGHAFAMAQRGEVFPGWKITEGKTRRYWPDVPNLEGALIDAGIPQDRIEDMWEPQVRAIRSPAQLEKLGKAFKTAVQAVAIKPPSGKLSFVPVDDRRKEIEFDNEFAEFGEE